MKRKLKVLVLFGLALAGGQSLPSAVAIDLEEPLVKPAPAPIPVPPVKTEPIRSPQPAPATIAPEAPAVAVEASDCANGKCHAGKLGKAKEGGEGAFHKCWAWLTYKPAKGSCDCREPTPYHPPLYTYFSCQERNCRSGCLTAPVMAAAPVAVAKKTEEPLRMPEMPKFAGPVNPLVPGSSSAMAEKREGTGVTMTNYKNMPVMPMPK